VYDEMLGFQYPFSSGRFMATPFFILRSSKEMGQQVGMKRAAKVLKRKQAKAKLAKKSNIKQAIYAFEKAMKQAGVAEHVHDENCKHEH